jgi:hypothetical protein
MSRAFIENWFIISGLLSLAHGFWLGRKNPAPSRSPRLPI